MHVKAAPGTEHLDNGGHSRVQDHPPHCLKLSANKTHPLQLARMHGYLDGSSLRFSHPCHLSPAKCRAARRTPYLFQDTSSVQTIQKLAIVIISFASRPALDRFVPLETLSRLSSATFRIFFIPNGNKVLAPQYSLMKHNTSRVLFHRFSRTFWPCNVDPSGSPIPEGYDGGAFTVLP